MGTRVVTSTRHDAHSAGARAAQSSFTPHPLWSPVVAGAVMLVPGALALATGQIFLFPSLGPTAVMQAQAPNHRSSQPYSILVAHTVGLLSAFLAVALFGIARAPSVFAAHDVSAARVGAAALSIALGTLLEWRLRAPHPPAASTTLLAALGSFHPIWHDTLLVLGGVLTVTVAGELARRGRRWARLGV